MRGHAQTAGGQGVYKDTHLLGLEKFCATRVQFPKLWTLPDERFKRLNDFHDDVGKGTLPQYSFIERMNAGLSGGSSERGATTGLGCWSEVDLNQRVPSIRDILAIWQAFRFSGEKSSQPIP